ncbi:MAG: proprotein convertase P-domain-containing protein, partial [Bacteroidales bacterium]|nr:proprotein convertase P-domain-containing protein [Bacteroidales bacterium]
CYTASVTFNLFDPGQTVLDSLDILGVSMNAEHTWVGDLKIRLVCPNGQSVILKDYIQNGGADLGQANSNDCLLPWCVSLPAQNPPGTGWTYTWSMNSPAGVMNDYVTLSQVDSVTYLPEQSFTDLAGCPLNGTWTLEVCDYWAYDNGYIFWWGLEIDPSLIPQAWEYTVGIDSLRINGQDIIFQNDSQLSVSPGLPGQYPYQFEIWDQFGCYYDTSFILTVYDLPVSGLPSDTMYCEGSPLPVLLPDSLGQGSAYAWWTNGSLLSTSQSYQPTNPGTYILGVLDPNGCSATDTILVTGAPKPSWTLSTQPATCGLANGQATVTLTGGTAQVYWVTLPPVVGNVYSDALPGTYTFMLNDNLCVYADSVTIGHIPPPGYTIVSMQKENCGKGNGELHLGLSGGTPPYSLEWHTTPPQYGPSATDLSAGPVALTLTDSLCVIHATLSLGYIPGTEAAFSFLPAVAEMPDPIYRFRDDSEPGVVLWAWDFGDGHGTSNDQNPVYRYDNADTFRVSLITTD